MAVKFGEAAPLKYWRWRLAETTGWSLEYIDGLAVADMFEYWQIQDGKSKALKPSAPDPIHAGTQRTRRGRR